MKKLICVLLSLAMLLAMSACSLLPFPQNPTEPENPTDPAPSWTA